ncbi:MAG: DNA polymerase III subunit delta [bacterium]|nr:DNA polymerase III subunit delta [bacterium]
MYKPVYVLLGENEHAKRVVIANIKQQVINNEPNTFNFNLIYGDSTSIEEILTLANTFSFLGGNRLVILKNFNKLAAADKKYLADYAKNPAPKTCFVVLDHSRPDKRSAWYKMFDQQKEHVQLKIFWSYKYRDLVNVVMTTFKMYAKNINYQAAEVLGSLLENNQESIDEEVKKIIDYVGDKQEISLADIRENIKKGTSVDIYEWAIAVTSGNKTLALKLLNNFTPKTLQASQLLIFVINDRFIKILKYLTLLNEGVNFKIAQKSLGIMSFLDPRFHQQTSLYDFDSLRKIFDNLIELDFKIKTGQGDPKMLLEEFIITL